MQEVRNRVRAIGQLNASFAPRHVLLGIPDVLDAAYSDSFIKRSQEGASTLASLEHKKGIRYNLACTVDAEAAYSAHARLLATAT